MKFSKRMLAALLTFTLALSLGLPAMAAVNWNEFVFTKQPRNITIKHGDSFTFSVEVNVPNGVEANYQWCLWEGENPEIAGATGPELRLGLDDPFYPPYDRFGGTSTSYRCYVTAYEKDNAGNIVSSRTYFTTARVDTERTASGKLYDLTIAPFVNAFGGSVGLISMTYGLIIPVLPVAFLGFLVFGFIQGFQGLFS